MKRLYDITITETLVHNMQIVASGAEEAEKIAVEVRCDKTVSACIELESRVTSLGRGKSMCRPNMEK